MLAVGGIYYLWCAAMHPPKEKFFICVDAERRWFLIINSRPVAKVAPETQLEVTNVEIGVLPKPESFIDTSRLMQLPPTEVAPAVRGDVRACRGSISPTLRQRIKECVDSHGVLPLWATAMVLNNL